MPRSSGSRATSGSQPTSGGVDWAALRSRTRDDVERIAREQRAELGLAEPPPVTRSAAVAIPDVRAIRETLGLSQAAFAARFHLRARTVQQWEQGRAVPDLPARILLRAIERFPEAIASAAASVEGDERAGPGDPPR